MKLQVLVARTGLTHNWLGEISLAGLGIIRDLRLIWIHHSTSRLQSDNPSTWLVLILSTLRLEVKF